ncbi:hypothetical protein V6N11_062250 [Hibiscus sabdariffa]|uniref:Isopenicillin N synthase-like Fe(2+) 2OG dioxygenase domain-containing protein n=1 Tax=Hibiscus sabdariffa TaxID=183260 RepID=A0ABR2PSJ6_9ROSI
MLDAVRGFHEQPHELKKAWYTSNEINRKTFDYNAKVAVWRDTVSIEFPDGELNELAIPELCRNVTSEYMKHMNQWVDVPYRHGYLTVNIGDLLQIVSNDKFKSFVNSLASIMSSNSALTLLVTLVLSRTFRPRTFDPLSVKLFGVSGRRNPPTVIVRAAIAARPRDSLHLHGSSF